MTTLRSSRQRHLLAALAVRTGRAVATDALLRAMWGDEPPASSRHALHVHVSSLRRLLEPLGIAVHAEADGYVLGAAADDLDAHVFEQLVATGRAAHQRRHLDTALARFDQALDLWRGPALADVAWDRFAEAEVTRLEELRRATEEDRLDLHVALGHEAVPDAEALVAAQPLRERRWRQLMVALYRTGRQVEALRRGQEMQALFQEELGIGPSDEMRRLEQQILHHDHALGAGSAPSGATSASSPGSGVPPARYTEVDGLYIAYQCIGEGPATLVFIPGMVSHLELRWHNPTLAGFFTRLARSMRVVIVDKAGMGLSDRRRGIPPLRDQVPHILGVVDAVGAERAVLTGSDDGAAIAFLAALAHPDRVAGVITYSFSPAPAAPDFPGAMYPGVLDGARAAATGGHLVDGELWAPSQVGNEQFARWAQQFVRMGVGVGDALRLYDLLAGIDLRDQLPNVTCPVLALHRAGDRLTPSSNAEWLATHIPGARAVVVPGDDGIFAAGDVDQFADEVERFVTEHA